MTSRSFRSVRSRRFPLRGELGPGHSSLKEIAGAAAEAEQQAIRRALEITMGTRARRLDSCERTTKPCILRLSSTELTLGGSGSRTRAVAHLYDVVIRLG
jgi:hypothetical protein